MGDRDREVRQFRSGLEVRAVGDGGRTIVGRACPFGVEAEIWDHFGHYQEQFQPGAFRRTIEQRGSRIPAFYGHDASKLPFGRAVDLREERDGLWTGLRASATPTGDEVLQLVRDGVLQSLSIAFTVQPGGDTWSRDRSSRVVSEAKIHEISVCCEPAYESAAIAGIRHTISSSGPPLTYWERRLSLLESEFLR